jgi:hypothetical protein
MEYLTLDEMSDQFKLQLDSTDKRLIANFLNAVARRNGTPTQQVRKRTTTDKGKHQSYWVTAYPAQFLDSFENLCMMLGAWS